MKGRLGRESLEKVGEIFRVLFEATHLTTLQEFKAGPRSVNDLVAAVGSSQANVSKQLRILFDAGFVKREKSGTQVFNSICEEIVFPMCELVCGKLNREAASSPDVHYMIWNPRRRGRPDAASPVGDLKAGRGPAVLGCCSR